MSAEELESCQEELEACLEEAEEARRRAHECLDYYDDLDMLVRALKEIPDRIYDYLSDKYGNVGISDIEIRDAIEDILSVYGVDPEGRMIKKEGRVRRHVNGIRKDCYSQLEECREDISYYRSEAEYCEAVTEERNELAEEIARDLPYLLAEEIARLINESDSLVSVSDEDIDEIADFIEDELEEHYYSKLEH